MVALLVGLKWRQLGHQLTRNPWMLVALVLSALTALSMLAAFVFGIAALRTTAPDAAAALLVIAGAVIVGGWWLGAVIVGADDSLAPERFALLPVRARRLLPGLVIAGATTVGGIGTAVALLAMLVGWSSSPLALGAAALLIPLALATCVLGARTVESLLAGWLARRRTRDLVVTLGVLVVASSGLLLNLLVSALADLGSPGRMLDAVAEVIAWTPLGAAFGVPAALAAGEPLTALLRFGVAVATAAVLWAVSERLLAVRLVAPVVRGGGGRVGSSALVDRMFPATPAGAVAARSLRYVRRDPRHLVNAVMLLLLPAVMVGAFAMNEPIVEGGVPPVFVLVPAINALLICTIVQMGLAYDNDTIALHIVTGVRGRDDRLGRLLGVGAFALPITALLCVLVCAFVGRWDLLPTSLGAALGASLVAAGAGAMVGAFLPGRAPAPGANPLGKGSSGGVQSLLALLIVLPVTLVGGAPALGFAIAALWTPALGWASLACALLFGGAAIWGGAVLGGRILDRRWPEVLAEVSSES